MLASEGGTTVTGRLEESIRSLLVLVCASGLGEEVGKNMRGTVEIVDVDVV